MKQLFYLPLLLFVIACTSKTKSENPFLADFNQPVDYAAVTAADVEDYANTALNQALEILDAIKQEETPNFTNTFIAYDDIQNVIGKANRNCFMLYWVSPDSLIRATGLSSYQLLDSFGIALSADKELYNKMLEVAKSDEYKALEGHRKNLVDDVIDYFEFAGVGLEDDKLEQFKKLTAEITVLTTEYSTNMNTANLVVKTDEKGIAGMPESFKDTYRKEDGSYEIPVINATRRPVLNNAKSEATRKDFYMKYYNRASDKNLSVLDEMVHKRHELAQLMEHRSYASYAISQKMAKTPENVWNFINDLMDRSHEKAINDHEKLKVFRNTKKGTQSNEAVKPWNFGYYRNHLLKADYNVDHEKIREYLPMERCLAGMLEIYQELLGLEFKKIEQASVWHEEVDLYEVYENGELRGRFYLDLFPRPNKESWFYAVPLTLGKSTEKGYEVPVAMLLSNFTRPTDKLPSLITHSELRTLFHEFGHVMECMSYNGEFTSQMGSLADFGEAMSQMFESWIWDYDMVSRYAKHYETGEVLPKDVFERMIDAKNITSGTGTQYSLGNCIYDMMLYDKYDPENPVSTDQLWRNLDKKLAVPSYVEGTHPQASWIHINTHPTYYYGYLWSEVYAADMFTVFEEKGLLDQPTGIRFRELILANGTQRDIVEAVDEFLGRPSNNEAYIKSLGLE
jgi:thimet oligopeptidase